MATTIDPAKVLSQLTEGFLKLPLMQKIIFPVLIVASVSGIIYVSKWANAPDYAVLFSDLEPADSAAVVERLKAQKISYEVRGDGRTVAVSPPEMINELRISLAGEGVPKGGVVGLEIFEGTNLGTTTFQEKIKFIRAIQGELERTISSLDAVVSARVHITQPEKTVFAKNSSTPTASVLLKLRPGAELTKHQIKGIANLVAGSVEGLDRENVTLIDVFGNLLNPKEDEGEGLGVEATRLQYQKEVEQSYVQRIEQMLQKVLGPGKSVARVTAELDFSSNEREEESYDPAGQVIRSERSIEEGSGESQRGGVPGVVTNLAENPNLLAPQNGATNNSTRREATKNYEVSRAVSKTSTARGKLLRLSAAVMVDGNYDVVPAPQGSDAPPTKTFKPLDPEVLTQIEGIVKSAIGFDLQRGDTVQVENIQFFMPDESLSEQLDSKATQDLIFNVVSKLGPVLFLVFFFLLIVRPLVKFLITPTEAEVDLTRLLPTGLNELEQELKAERSTASIPNYEPAVDMEQLEELIAENARIVKENPQQAALLIRYWLNDGRL